MLLRQKPLLTACVTVSLICSAVAGLVATSTLNRARDLATLNEYRTCAALEISAFESQPCKVLQDMEEAN